MTNHPSDADFKAFVRRSILAAALGPTFFIIPYSIGMVVPVNVLNTWDSIFGPLIMLSLLAGILICPIWIFIFGEGLYRFGRRGLWLLFEAPFGLIGLGWIVWVVIRCSHTNCAWP
jgi:hypothetical protein